jgi:hypothetical protein
MVCFRYISANTLHKGDDDDDDDNAQNSEIQFPRTFFRYPFLVIHILSPDSVISNLHMFLSFSSYCQSPVDGCPTPIDVFSYRREVKMLIRIVRNVLFLWLGKTRDV